MKSWLAPEKFFHERSNAISFVRVLRRYLGNNILWKKKFFFILTDLTLIFSFSFEKKNKYKASRVRDNFYKQIYLLRFSLEKWTNTKQISNIDQISLSLVNIFIFIDRWISKEKKLRFQRTKNRDSKSFFLKEKEGRIRFLETLNNIGEKIIRKAVESRARRGTIVQGRSTRVFFYHRRSLLAPPIIQNYSLNRSLHDFNESIIN